MPLGIVSGLALEARRLGRARAASNTETIVATGAGESAARAAERLVASGAEALMSFGLAGALNPELVSGDLVVAARIVEVTGASHDCDEGWRAHLVAALRQAGVTSRVGALLGSDVVVAEPEEKVACHLESGAQAIDTESHHVARTAAAAGLPFAALRVIVDPQQYRIPASALVAYGDDGVLRPLTLAVEIMRRPTDLPALLALARRSRTALRSLGRVGGLGAGLALPL
jgi:adenosylhomocysteine nucleosidase